MKNAIAFGLCALLWSTFSFAKNEHAPDDFCSKNPGLKGCETGKFNRKRYNLCTKHPGAKGCGSKKPKTSKAQKHIHRPSPPLFGKKLSPLCRKEIMRLRSTAGSEVPPAKRRDIADCIKNNLSLSESAKLSTLRRLRRLKGKKLSYFEELERLEKRKAQELNQCLEKYDCKNSYLFQDAFSRTKNCHGKMSPKGAYTLTGQVLLLELNKTCAKKEEAETESWFERIWR